MIEYYLPFIFQGVFMTFDEFHFHYKRPLPSWEKIGHPLDTLTVFLTLSLPAFFPYSDSNKQIFIILSIFSCLFITKDEFIHSENCSKSEHLLHALLFILHPITFMAAYLLWKGDNEIMFLKIQASIVFTFMLYQIIKWSIPWKKIRK